MEGVFMNRSKRMASILLILLIHFASVSLIGMQVVRSSDPVDQTVDLVFTINPEGWVTVDGMMNDTTTATSPINFTAYGDVTVTEEAAIINMSLLIPAENATNLPIDSTSFSLLMDYETGYSETNFTVTLPPKQILSQSIPDSEVVEQIESFLNSTDFVFDAEYEGGDVHVTVQHTMVSNLTALIGSMLSTSIGLELPFTLGLNYSQGEYVGSTRLVLLPGLPMKDLVMDVVGNLTDICFNGTVFVMYGDYSYLDPSFGLVNETMLDELELYAETIFNASIAVEGSLLNMSSGLVESSYINIEREAVNLIGETITFEVCISEAMPGGFVFAPFYLLSSEAWEQEELSQMFWVLASLNTTLHHVQDAKFQLVYTPADTKLDLTIDGTLHVRDFVEQLLEPIAISEAWQEWGLPPELNATLLPFNWLALEGVNNTASALETSTLHLAYYRDDRKVEVNSTSLVNMEGFYEDLPQLLLDFPFEQIDDFELPSQYAEVIEALLTNRLAIITLLQASLTYVDGEAYLLMDLTFEGDINAEINYIKSQLIRLLDATEPLPWQVLYLNDTTIDVTGLECIVKMNNLSTEIVVKEMTIRPPNDPINATAFKLDRFFNLTADETLLEQKDRLRVTIVGGSNATHTVTLFNGTGVPMPDSVTVDADDRFTRLSWDNVTLSDLRALQFLLIDLPPISVTLSTPTQTDISETSVVLSWSENEDPDFVRYEIFQSSSLNVLGTSIANITDQQVTSFTVTDLSTDASYYFTIRVVDDAGQFTDSSQIAATTILPIWMQSWFFPLLIGSIAIGTISIFFIRRRNS